MGLIRSRERLGKMYKVIFRLLMVISYYTWTKAKSGTKYTFTVKAYNSKGTAGGYDKTGKSITYVATPTVEVSLTTDGIKVSWDKCKGAGAYRVFYKTSANGTWTKIGDTTATSYTRKNSKLTSGTKYWFTVRCVKAKNSKTYVSAYDTAGKAVTYEPVSKIGTPKLKTVENVATGVKITWGKVFGAAKYRVYYKGGDKKDWTKLADTTETSYTWTKAKSGTKYTFTVKGYDVKGAASGYNKTGKSVTYYSAPAVNIMVRPNGNILVNWTKSEGAPLYMIFWRVNGGAWKKDAISPYNLHNKLAEDLESGKTYEFTVRCCTKDRKTMLSGYKVSNSLKYLAAPKVKIARETDGDIKVSWNKIKGAELYMVYYKVNGGNWKKIGTTAKTSYTRAASKLTGGTYQFTVRCVMKDEKTMLSGYKASNKLQVLSAPLKFTAQNAANGINFSWNSVSGAKRYRLYYSEGSGTPTRIATVAKTSYLWTHAEKGKTYTFTVYAEDSNGFPGATSQVKIKREVNTAISLDVPSFKQGDSRWANVRLGNRSGTEIKTVGCTVTSIAMIQSYRTGQTIYPDAMSKQLEFTDGGGLKSYPSWLSMKTSDDDYLTKIYEELKAGKPVLMEVKKTSGGQHWVVITGFTGGTLTADHFTINDPGSNSRTVLEQLFTTYPVTGRYYCCS